MLRFLKEETGKTWMAKGYSAAEVATGKDAGVNVAWELARLGHLSKTA